MIVLQRLPEYMNATPGTILINEKLFCYSIELPWHDNRKFVSCIPAGFYELQRTYSNHFKRYTWEILDVPGRDGIRLHSANVVTDLEGCVAPCMHLEIQNYRLWGADSTKARSLLDDLLFEQKHPTIEVKSSLLVT